MSVVGQLRLSALRAAFFLTNIGLVAVIWTFAIAPLLRVFSDQNERLAELGTQILEYEDIASEASSVRDAAALERSRTQDTRSALLAARDEGAAEADLLRKLRASVEGLDIRIQAATAIAAAEFSGVPVVGAHLDLSGNNASIMRAIERIESAAPMLFIGEVALKSVSAPAVRPPDGGPELEASLNSYAPWRMSRDVR